MYLSLCVYSIKDCLHKTLITVIKAYMYHLYMLFRSVRPIALYMAQISCQMKSGRHVASFWGKKGGIFYKILTSRKKVKSQNYKNSNLWRGKKQVGAYMYCTYNFYFSFFKYRRGLLPPPPPTECYVPVWCPAFFISDCKFRFIHTLRRYGCTSAGCLYSAHPVYACYSYEYKLGQGSVRFINRKG